MVGASVRVANATATSARGGRFELRGLAAHAECSVQIRAAGFAHVERPLTLWPDASNDLGDLVLHPAARIVGRVVDADGRPVGGASVLLDPPGACTAMTAAEGTFELANVGPGAHRVRARLAGRPASRAARVDVVGGATARCADLVLLGVQPFVGRVTDDRDAPVAGAEVRATARDTEEEFTAVTRSDGSFEWASFPASEAEIVVTHEGYLPFARCYAAAETANVRLTSTRVVFGRVVDGYDGTPVPLTRVALLVAPDPSGPWRQLSVEDLVQDASTRTEDVGAFCIAMGIHANVRVLATSATHAPTITAPEWMGRTDVGPLRATARPGVAVRGVLHDERGCPIPGADIEVLGAPFEGGLVQTGDSVVLAHTQTNTDGSFVTTQLANGPHRLRARRDGYVAAIEDVDVGGAERACLELVATRAGVVRGTILGAPADQGRLRVVADPVAGLGPRERAPSAVVEHGAFCFASLPLGTYRLRVLGLGQGQAVPTTATVVEVKAGTQGWVEILVGAPAVAAGAPRPVRSQ